MPLSDPAVNAAADAVTGLITHLSLHTAWSASGASEVTGGSPAYARQPVAWNAAATRVAANTDIETFDVPAGTDVAFIGGWSALSGGTFYGMAPLQSLNTDIATGFEGDDYFYADGHGFSDGDTVVVFEGNDAVGVPGGLSEGTVYYVRDSAVDRFKLAATSGGVAINLTSTALVFVQGITVESFAAQGSLTIAAGNLQIKGFGGSI